MSQKTVDIAIVGTILSVLPRPVSPLSYGIAGALIVPALYVEWEVYHMLWPSEEAVLEAMARKRAVPAPRAPAVGRSAAPGDPAPGGSASGGDEGPPPET